MKTQRGLTLIELVMFIVIVSVGVAGILLVLNVTVRGSADPMVRKQALAVAEALMDEVLSKEFANPAGGASPAAPGNPTQTERPTFDDVSDYHMAAGWQWSGVRSLTDTGTNIAGLENYTLTIAVSPTTDLSGIDASNAKKIAITVDAGNGHAIQLVGYRTRYE